MDQQVVIVAAVIAAGLIGLAAIRFLRWPICPVDDKSLPIRLSRRAHQVGNGGKQSQTGASVELVVDGIDPTTHEILCHVALVLPRDLLLGIVTLPMGAGASGYPPLVKIHPSYPSQLVLSNPAEDPTLTLVIWMASADVASRELCLHWKISEILAGLNARDQSSQARFVRDLRIETDHQPRLFPDDRYLGSFFAPRLCMPPSCCFRGSGSQSTFIIEPPLSLRAGTGLQHWELRMKPPDEGHSIKVGLRRGRGERWSVEALSLAPLLLVWAIAWSVGGGTTSDLSIKATSVFLSIVALRSIVPASAQNFGLTKAELRLQLAGLIMLLILIVKLFAPPVVEGSQPSTPEAIVGAPGTSPGSE